MPECLPHVLRLELRLSSQHDDLWLQATSRSPDVLDFQLSFAANVLDGIWNGPDSWRALEFLTLGLINTKKQL